MFPSTSLPPAYFTIYRAPDGWWVCAINTAGYGWSIWRERRTAAELLSALGF